MHAPLLFVLSTSQLPSLERADFEAEICRTKFRFTHILGFWARVTRPAWTSKPGLSGPRPRGGTRDSAGFRPTGGQCEEVMVGVEMISGGPIDDSFGVDVLCGDGCSDRVELIGAQLRVYVSIYIDLLDRKARWVSYLVME